MLKTCLHWIDSFICSGLNRRKNIEAIIRGFMQITVEILCQMFGKVYIYIYDIIIGITCVIHEFCNELVRQLLTLCTVHCAL